MAKVMTYGVMPTLEEFERAFDEKCPSGMFTVRNCKRVGNENYTCFGLWTEVQTAVLEWGLNEESSEAAGNWASAILASLGFEWV